MFEKLEVYQKSLDLAEKVILICEALPKGNSFLSEQLKKAVLSIPLNIAEGTGRWHKADKKQFYLISRGSAYECIPLIELAKRKGIISEKTFLKLKTEIEEICKMLTKLIQAHSLPSKS